MRYPFSTGDELLAHAAATGLSISDIVMANEMAWHTEGLRAHDGLLRIWSVMQECIQAGIDTDGVLPGGLKVRRRAPMLAESSRRNGSRDPFIAMDRVNLYAIAVNEQKRRVVAWSPHRPTARRASSRPCCSTSTTSSPGADDDGTVRFLLVAGGNRQHHQGERLHQRRRGRLPGRGRLGVLDGGGRTHRTARRNARQVENAAEIGIEHNLGLTCDPVGGLVQIPCIERNAVGAVKAITAARIALSGDGTHQVSLDKAVKTMRETGADMKDKYKETARGGLALNVVEC